MCGCGQQRRPLGSTVVQAPSPPPVDTQQSVDNAVANAAAR